MPSFAPHHISSHPTLRPTLDLDQGMDKIIFCSDRNLDTASWHKTCRVIRLELLSTTWDKDHLGPPIILPLVG